MDKMNTEPHLTNAQINKYSIYSLATITAMMPAFLYYRTFMQVNLGIPAELLAVLVLVGTGADFVFSLIAGPVIAKSSGGKWGKYRIFFVFAPWIMFAGTAIVYAAPAGINSALIKGIITILGYLMICGAVSFMGNANFGLIATMAGPSMEIRNRMTARAAQMMALASILVSALILP